MVLYVSWSLTVELIFYALATASFALPVALAKSLVPACGIGTFLILVWIDSLTHSDLLIFVSFFLEFVAGMTVCLYREKLTSRWLIGPLVIAALVAFAAGANLHATSNPVRVFTFGVGALALVMLALVLEQSQSLIASRSWVALGDASYTLYLLHPSLLTVFYFWGLRDFLAGQSVFMRETGFFLYLGLGFWVSRAIYVWMERPIYQWASSSRRHASTVLRL